MDFQDGRDKIFADGIAQIGWTNQNGSALIQMDSTSVLLQEVPISALDQSDFIVLSGTLFV